MTQIGGRNLAWTSYNMVSSITGTAGSSFAGVSASFTYDAEHNRVKQVGVDKDGLSTTTIYVGAYEKITRGIDVEQRHHIQSPTGPIAVYALRSNWVEETNYLLKDHLGSIVLVTNTSGTVVTDNTFSFDAWGKRRDPVSLSNLGVATDYYKSAFAKTTHGFTGHEELDNLGLVHMNGRIYDPEIGRFISADPFVQDITQTQNFNRYSYVLNNSLSLTDPSGFNFLNNFGSWLNKHLGSTGTRIVIGVIAVVVAVVAIYAAPYIYSTLGATALYTTSAATGALTLTSAGAVVAAAGAGFSSTFLASSLAGASLGEAFQAGLRSAAVAAVTAGILEYGLPALSRALNPNAQVNVYKVEVANGRISTSSALDPGFTVSESVPKIYINGINTDFNGAIQQAAKKIGDGTFYVIHNPSNGFIQDIIETAADNFSHQPTDVAKNVAQVLKKFPLSGTTIYAHSQGAAITNAALAHIAKEGVTTSGLTVSYYGAAVNKVATLNQFHAEGIKLGKFQVSPFDIVPNIVGGNAITGGRPLNIFLSIIGFPYEFSDHGAHSSYGIGFENSQPNALGYY